MADAPQTPSLPPPTGGAAPPPPGPAVGAVPPAQGWGGPAPVYASTPKTDGTAIAALVCAIAGWVVCPVILAVIALSLAHVSGNKIDASGGALTGNGMVKAAKIVAWVHLGLLALVLVIAAIALAALNGTSSLGSWVDIQHLVRS